MGQRMAMMAVAGSCAVVFIIFFLKNRAALALNFLIRMVVGIICILAVNSVCAKQGMGELVGVNPVTLLTTGVIGIPGVALLYGVMLLNFL